MVKGVKKFKERVKRIGSRRLEGKGSTLRWFGHIERMENEEFVKVYRSSVEGTNRRGRPFGRWEDRVKEYVSERGVRGNELEAEEQMWQP